MSEPSTTTINWDPGPRPAPPALRLEIAHGDRRAAAILPADAGPERLGVVCGWLVDLSATWETR